MMYVTTSKECCDKIRELEQLKQRREDRLYEKIVQSMFLTLFHWIQRIIIYRPLGYLFPIMSQIIILQLVQFFQNLRDRLTLETDLLGCLIHLLLLLHRIHIHRELNLYLISRVRIVTINT